MRKICSFLVILIISLSNNALGQQIRKKKQMVAHLAVSNVEIKCCTDSINSNYKYIYINSNAGDHTHLNGRIRAKIIDSNNNVINIFSPITTNDYNSTCIDLPDNLSYKIEIIDTNGNVMGNNYPRPGSGPCIFDRITPECNEPVIPIKTCEINCCNPTLLTDKSFLRKQFNIQIVDSSISTYKLDFVPTNGFINLINSFDNFNKEQLQNCYNEPVAEQMYKAVQQFHLWEITNSILDNATGADILSTHIFIDTNRTNRDLFYHLTTTNRPNYIMQPNKWYVLQYGFYYDNLSPFVKCGYNGTMFAIKVTDTGLTRIINIQTNKSEIISEKKY